MQGNGRGSEATRYLLIDRGREREIAGKMDMEEREEKEEKEDEKEEEEEEGEGGDEETDEKGISCV